jgi:peptidoglycan hydrolase-like protein with peptidoglycan-binding domain
MIFNIKKNNYTIAQKKVQKVLFFLSVVPTAFSVVFAETVVGGGYTVQQVIAPIDGALSGNGYILQSASQNIAGAQSGGGYTVTAPMGTQTPVVTPPPSGGGGGSISGGGGYFILNIPLVSTSSIQVTPLPDPSKTIITENGSSCKSRVVFSSPIDVDSKDNVKKDVKKLETFLNVYENEKLPVNGVYEVKDIIAVKKWQQKYKSFILEPMRLKKPTGTVYHLSQKQIERQTTKSCGQPVTITACPYFTTYSKYGDRGQDVKKIQQFLNIVQGETLGVSGVYGPLTRDAVKRFQRVHKKYVFSFISLDLISGNWNVSTQAKANEVIGCGTLK